MPTAQRWRLTGAETYAAGAALELGSLHLYNGSGRVDAPATLTSSHAPSSGTLGNLQDADAATLCAFDADDVRSPGFFVEWDFGVGNTESVWGLRLGASEQQANFLSGATLQYWSGATWLATPLGRYAWPGASALTAPPSGPAVFGRAPGAKLHESSGSRYWGASAISADGQTIYKMHQSYSLYKSSDRGGTWGALAAAGSGLTSALACSDDGLIIMGLVYWGYVRRSADGGASWTDLTGAGARPWQSVTCSADGQRIAASGNGTYIYTSADGGATWTERTGAGSKAWRLSCSADGLTILAAPSNGG